MRERLDYWRRLIATALSFTTFGLGGLLLRLFVFPLINLITPDPLQKRYRSRLVVSTTFRWFVELMHWLGVLNYEIIGQEKLGRPGQLIIANHPSLIDVVFLIAFVRDANCVVKGSHWRNPFTRGPITAAQYVDNGSTLQMIEQSIEALENNQTLIIFPEGTRTKPQEALHFQRGAANVALKSARLLTPVVIRVKPTTLTKAEPWYRIPSRRFTFSMRVGEDIDLEAFRAKGETPRASRALNDYLLAYFTQELKSP